VTPGARFAAWTAPLLEGLLMFLLDCVDAGVYDAGAVGAAGDTDWAGAAAAIFGAP